MEERTHKLQSALDDEGLVEDTDTEHDTRTEMKTTTTTGQTNGFKSNGETSPYSCNFWTTDTVIAELEKQGLYDIARVFKDKGISAQHLNSVTETTSQQLNICDSGKQSRVLNCLKRMQSDNTKNCERPSKVINDPIHGHIELHPLCVAIMDTPQFQRLRNIKQLGACYHVFPGASHNRFEHSIGVCHLAGELGRTIQSKQDELGIDSKDILCLEIAGLLHDLGHGPFSHMFDQRFIPAVTNSTTWTHEEASVDMFQYLIDDNDLKDIFTHYDLKDVDVKFIKELIAGPKSNDQVWPYEGREEDKSFLYEIVANKRNGIDVDKWDYFARDCHGLGIKNSFDHSRCMKFIRVLSVEGRRQICFEVKEVGNLYDMFYTRLTLHRRAYQHPVNKVIEEMLTKALIGANDHLKFRGKEGALLKMSEAIKDMAAYMKMTDYVVQQILLSEDPGLKKSQKILNNIARRKLLKCVARSQPTNDKSFNPAQIHDRLFDILKGSNMNVREEDVNILMICVDYGMKDENPVDHVRFYSKNEPNKAFQLRKDEVSKMLPETFAEKIIGVYTKSTDKEVIKNVGEAFTKFCEQNGMKAKIGKDPLEMTPAGKKRDLDQTLIKTGSQERSSSPSAKKCKANLFKSSNNQD